ncbi:hypothetical protein MBANPS3_001234 [Mucor bainieri]
MSPSRRTRKSNTAKKSKPSRVATEDSSDERSSDAGSVTRCICGQGHNVGLMVQCDKCEVWQHCECIGLVQARLPDQYFCDQCQPENHQIVKTSSGRSKRLYNAGLVSSANSTSSPSLASSDKEEASTSTTSTAKRPSKRRKKATAATAAADKAGCHSPPKTPLMEAKTEQASPVMNTIEESPVIEERSTRSRRTKIPADAVEQGTITASAPLSAATLLIPELVKKAPASSSSPSSSASVSPSPAATTTTTTTTTTTEKKSTKTRANSNRHSSSSATPQQQILDDFGSPSTHHHHQHHNAAASSSSSTPYWNFSDGRPMRESSPPAKIKYPNSRMSFSDMNKRAKQIMECIAKMQTEELKRLPPPSLNSKHPDNHTLPLFQEVDPSAQTAAPFNRPRSLSTSSTSSSLSSASTVPLLDDYATTTTSASSSPSTPIPYKHFPHQSTPAVQQHSPEQETSIEILERVSRELAKFQRKFGIVYQNQPHHHYQHHHHHHHHQQTPHAGSNGHAKSSTTSK